MSDTWHGKTVGQMTQREFSDWVDAGRPSLAPQPKAPKEFSQRALVQGVAQAMSELQRTLTKRHNAALAKMKEEFTSELTLLRAEVRALREREQQQDRALPLKLIGGRNG